MFKKANYVYAVYQEGNFTKAAEKLFISQPCLSTAIKQLEQKLGAPLFERNTASVKPTELGLRYIQTAEKMLEMEQDFLSHVRDIQSLSCGTVRVGGSNYISTHVLPRIIDRFTEQYPDVVVSLTEASSAVLQEQLQADAIDLVVDSFDHAHPNCTQHHLAGEKILLAVPKALPCNAAISGYATTPSALFQSQRSDTLPAVSLEHFAGERFILLKSGNSMYDHAMQVFRTGSVTPKVGMFLDQLATSYFLATQGNGCCFVTDTMFRYHKFEDAVYLYNITGSGNRSLDIAHKKGRHLMPAERMFIQIAQSILTQESP